MKQKFNISFKRQAKITGLAGVGYPNQSVDIKVNKKEVGIISAPNWQTKDNNWRVRLTVKKQESDDNPNRDWKWVSVKKTFENEESARQWVKDNLKTLSMKYELHYFED